jgi:hypothetical protein
VIICFIKNKNVAFWNWLQLQLQLKAAVLQVHLANPYMFLALQVK